MDYKKILEGVVDIINTAEKSDIGFANICTYIGENCPELKESEDEKVRKELIKFLQECHNIDSGFFSRYCEIPFAQTLAWLEKQSRQKPWSEENEEMIDETLYFIREYQQSNRCKDEAGMQNSVSCEKWLKSLKDKYTWKPSIAQLNALSIVSKGNAPDDIEAIMSLYNDLKKLRGE